MAGPVFRRDLYRGTARDCERFRVPYPPGLTAGLADRAGADGRGTLLDLAHGRVPPGHEQARRDRPDGAILRDAGFEAAGACQLRIEHDWTAEDLAGFALSTSVLSRAVLGGMAGDCAADLRRALHASRTDGRFRQTIDFACDLARRPA